MLGGTSYIDSTISITDTGVIYEDSFFDPYVTSGLNLTITVVDSGSIEWFDLQRRVHARKTAAGLARTYKKLYQSPKVINRKLSAYSCSMRGRSKPCRRVAIVNQE